MASDDALTPAEALEAAILARCGKEIAEVVQSLAGRYRYCEHLTVETPEAQVKVEVWRKAGRR
jgi:hypothetical protein